MPPGFQEDPELLAAVGGGSSPRFQEDDELLQTLQAPRPANQQEANGPDMPTAQNGRVIEMPTQQVQGDPRAGGSGWDNLLQSLIGHPEMNRDAQPNPYLMSAYGGLTHGITAGADQLIPGGAGAAIRDARAEAQAAHPSIYGGFDIAGGLVSPMAALAAPAAGATPLAAGIRAGAVLGPEGAASRYADNPNASAGDIARAGVRNAAGGFLFGAGAQGIANRLGGAADTAGAAADSARVRAAGIPANQAAYMGAGARAELAGKIEDPANGLITRPFQSPTGYLNNAKNLQARGLAGMQGAEGQIAALHEQPSVPVGDLIAAQRAKASAQRTLADPGNVGPSNFRDQFATNLQGDADNYAASSAPSGPYRYHTTPVETLDAIKRGGLRPGSASPSPIGTRDGEPLYFADDKDALNWARQLADENDRDMVMLRTRAPMEGYTPQYGRMAGGEYTTRSPIPPGHLEVSNPYRRELLAPTAETRGSLGTPRMPKGWAQLPATDIPWQRAVEQRRNIDGFTNFGSTNAEESAQNAIRKEIGGGLREGIDQSLSSPNVPPELASQWRGGRDQYALGSQVGEAAFKAIPNTHLPASTGEVPGFFARRGGMSAVAGTARGAQSVLGSASEVTPQVAQQALQGWLAQKGVPQNSQANTGSTGGVSGQRAEQALQVNPALLGKWAPQFEEAQRTGGSEAVRALVTKLALNDPAFRTGPYQQLSQGRQNGN
jgi:hypothetical protein